MSDREMRQVLQAVIEDIDSGRVAVPRPRGRLLRYLGPPLIAASLGMAACGDTGVAPLTDASAQDATVEDGGPQPAYIAPFDGGPVLEYMAPFDAEVKEDGGVQPAYIAPFDGSTPLDDGAVMEYMAPFDAEAEDGGAIPLYMGPPPPEGH